MKHWLKWFKKDIQKLYYKLFYNFNMEGFNGTVLPHTGKGKFVNVFQKGKIIQIIDHCDHHPRPSGHYDEIRIIPDKNSHGVLIERIINGKVMGRQILDIGYLNKLFESNKEKF